MSGRGLRGAVLSALGAKDHPLTVVDREEVTGRIVRLRFAAAALLDEHAVGPTTWARLWFPAGSRLTPRAFTLVRPDRDAGTVEVEFALHDGPASWWARGAGHGDRVTATLTGSSTRSAPPPQEASLLIGDPASLPAINSVLCAGGRPGPRAVLLERQDADDERAPVHARPDTPVIWVDREPGGAALAAALSEVCSSVGVDRAWVACETATTRRVADALRREHRFPPARVTARGYWTER